MPLVNVYHAGDDRRPKAPFLIVLSELPRNVPLGPNGFRKWVFWKQVPLSQFAIEPNKVARHLTEVGYYIQ